MPDAREEELRRLSRWLAFSERVDCLIESSEASATVAPPAPMVASAPVLRTRNARARLAAGLARAAVALHGEAAAGAVLTDG